MQLKPHQLSFWIFLTLSWTNISVAQTTEEEDLALAYGDTSYISIATGSQQTLRRAPSVASVITAEEIATMGAKDLDEALESIPGIHVSNAGTRSFSVYQIRGINGNPTNPQVLILQNGIPIKTLFRGDKGEVWGSQPLEDVARIEIIRGPGSALYGADAYSGVINIITKTAGNIQGTEFGIRGGSFNSKNSWIQHGSQWGDLDMVAYLNIGNTSGHKQIVTTDAQKLRDIRFATAASLAPGSVNTGYDAVDASLDFRYSKWNFRNSYKLRDNLGTGTGVSSALDPVGQNRGERFISDLSWNDPQFSQNWELGFNASLLHYSEQEYLQLSPPGSKFGPSLFPNGMIGSPSRQERQIRTSGFAVFSGLTDHTVRAGLGHDDLNIYKTSTLKNYVLSPAGAPIPAPLTYYFGNNAHLLPQQRKIDYIFVQDAWNFAQDWTLTAGVRHDRYSDFGSTTNPRLAVVWDANIDLTAKLLYGEAFRAPSFTEQYGINPVSNGNPKLKPESIKTLEAALSWQTSMNTKINLNLFRYGMASVIRTVTNPTPGTGSTFQNTGTQHGSGMEVEATWDTSRTTRITANYSYQKSIDDATNQDAGYVPHHRIYMRGDWRFLGNWITSTQINHVMDRKRAVLDTRPQIPDYTTVDLTVRSSTENNHWNFSASIRNLLNASVLEPSLYGSALSPTLPTSNLPNDVPMAPRSLWLQATYLLGN